MLRRPLAALAAIVFAGSAFAQGQFGNFVPDFGKGTSIPATTTSASITFTGTGIDDSELYVVNAGTDISLCRWGTGAQTALLSDIPLPAGAVQVFYKGRGADTVACRTATGIATIYLIPGYGR